MLTQVPAPRRPVLGGPVNPPEKLEELPLTEQQLALASASRQTPFDPLVAIASLTNRKCRSETETR